MHNIKALSVFCSCIRKTIETISPAAMSVLKYGLFLAATELGAITALAWRDSLRDPLYAEAYYGPMTEYIMMTLVLVVAGAMLFDIVVKRTGQE